MPLKFAMIGDVSIGFTLRLMSDLLTVPEFADCFTFTDINAQNLDMVRQLEDIREVAKSGALFLNYANPMAMLTWACNKYGGVKTVSLCHGVGEV